MNVDNGAGADRLAPIADALRAELERETEVVARAQAELDAAKATCARLQGALDMLTKTKAPRAKAPRPAQATTPRPATSEWRIGEPKVEQVRAAMVTKTEPIGTTEVAAETGMSTDSARRALKVLRERDLVRVAGRRRGRGGGQELFMPMPEVVTDAD